MTKLFDWRFDAYRIKEYNHKTKGRTTKEIQDVVDGKLIEHELEIEDHEDFLNLFFPLLNENISQDARNLFNLIKEVVILVGSETGGGMRESLDQTLSIVSREGFCPVVVRPIILEYERLLFEEHYKITKD